MTARASAFQAAMNGDHTELSRILAADPGAATSAGPGNVGILLAAVRALPSAANKDGVDMGAALCIPLLVRHGADPSMGAHGWLPIHEAANRCLPKTLRALLDAGADPNSLLADGSRRRPIHLLADRPLLQGFHECLLILADAGCDLLARDLHKNTAGSILRGHRRFGAPKTLSKPLESAIAALDSFERRTASLAERASISLACPLVGSAPRRRI